MNKPGPLVAIVAIAACGRIGFDPTSAATGTVDAPGSTNPDGLGGDGPPAASCESLPPTCGPTGTSPCCDSPPVPRGTFYRSYDLGADNGFTDMTNPATVSEFRLDKYEITVGRFRKFVAAGGGTQASPPTAGAGAHTNIAGSGWDATWNTNLAADMTALVASVKCSPPWQTWTDAPGSNEDRPMNCISWYEAMAFCIWDGGYLPTEAEWNYAASGGALQRAYPWSNPPSSLEIDDSTYASYWVDSTKQCMGDMVNGCALTDLVSVGSKPAGDGMFGQSDLAGNVWEWVLDWDGGAYPNPCIDCANVMPATDRVVRGGGWAGIDVYLRGAFRVGWGPFVRDDGFGARCARAP